MTASLLKASKTKRANGKKRKAIFEASTASKKARYVNVPSSKLRWKRTAGAGYDFDGFEGGEGGMLELEEIDDVDIVWEEGADGSKTVSFKVKEDNVKGDDEESDEEAPFAPEDVDDGEEEWTGISNTEDVAKQLADKRDGSESEPAQQELEPEAGPSKGKPAAPLLAQAEYETDFDDSSLPGFRHLHLLSSLKRALAASGFSKPSPIQDSALSTVLTEDAHKVAACDLIGVAETGSGKTLAYSLPVLQEIMRQPAEEGKKRPLAALVLCPTRELALQVRQHVGDIIYKASVPPSQSTSDSDQKVKHTPRANIITICGGMSIQKQKRLLNTSYGVDIIVATPGRLWDMIEEDENLGKQIKGAKFLVLDEADRMIENGHFAELESIVALTRRKAGKGKGRQTAAAGGEVFEDDFENPEASLDACPVREDMNTYVFSATMSKELQRNVKRLSKRSKTAMGSEEQGHMGALGDLLAKLDFRDEDPKVIDLTPEGGVVKSLQEVKIDCLLTEKDAYLYYFLLRYPGRTLVFLSSIDAIRRLQPLLQLLEVNVAVLHSGMQQRARLKALDRFKTAESMVLLATDVAARGLDVPAVEHVVHYQLPRTADTYIHRSGRTARAGNEGLSLQLCAPEEKPTQKALMKSMNKSEKLKELPVEFSLLNKLKERVELAKQIEIAQHRASKAAHEENWLAKAAEDMEVDLDGDDSDGGRGMTKRKSKAAAGKEKELRGRLKQLLAQPLMARGVSARYLTAGGSSQFAEAMLRGTNHKTMLGLGQTRAVDDVQV